MSEELRPCPFCGGKAVTSTFFDWDDLEYMPIEVNDYDAEVTCENERCINGWYISPKAWNNRPIEDALRKRIAELEAAQRWIPVSERLPEVGEEVFVCDESGHRREDWLVCKQIDGVGETLFYSAAYDYDPPTHWMPLPEPPEVTG